MNYQFGSGTVWGLPTAGNMGPDPTPMQLGILQSVDIEFSRNVKELYGSYGAPVVTVGGAMKITGKAKFAQFSGKVFNDLFWGQTTTTGQTLINLSEADTVPASTPYTVTVSQSAKWTQDLGVTYADGTPFVAVTGTPTQGQYSVAAGVYTFAAADTGAAVLISYAYTATTGVSVTVTNQVMGFGPRFQLFLYQLKDSNQSNLKLFSVTATKLGRQTKTEDFTIPELDFSASADANGNIAAFWDAQ